MMYTINDKEVSREEYLYSKEDGVRKKYYDSGVLECETPYVNSKVHGIEKLYYESGELEWETPYVNGKRHGTHKAYYKSGELEYATPYVNDEIREDLLLEENRLLRLILIGE